MPLTDTWLRSTNGKHRTTLLEKSDHSGLSVRVSKKGKITFQLRYRFLGKAHRLDLGGYPNISLKQARELSFEYKNKLSIGINPKTHKDNEFKKNIKASTVDELFYLWYDSYCSVHHKYPQLSKRCYEIHISPKMGDKIFDHTSLHEWLTVFEQLARKYSTATWQALSIVKNMTKWGSKRQFIFNKCPLEISPNQDLKLKKVAVSRVLTDDEIKIFYSTLNTSRIPPHSKIMLQLLLHFACRGNELRLAKKSHFNFEEKTWIVPAENHKAGYKTNEPLIRPIIDEVIPLLKFAFALSNGEYAFSPDTAPVYRSTLCRHARIIIKNSKKAGNPMERWTIHDLRRTARSRLSRLTHSDVAEKMVGHSFQGVRKIYDRYDYLEEQTQAYKAWWKEVDSIVGLN